MANDSVGDKTEPATPRKKQKAREEGQVARSQDLNNSILLLTAVIVFFFYGEYLWERLLEIQVAILPNLHQFPTTPASAIHLGRRGLLTLILLLVPMFAAVVVMSFAANLIQVGLVFTGRPLVLKFDRLNPISGMRRIVGIRSFAKLLGSFFKLGVIGTVLWVTLAEEFDHFFLLVDLEVGQVVAYIGAASFRLAIRTAIALLVLAILDYSYQRWQHEQDLRMSKQEIKDEMKLMEGDPRIRARRRQIALQLAQQRMMSAVPKADVVVTNPTFLAVALSYTKDMQAPRVVAKGAGKIAERIRNVAAEHSIPVIERKEVARALFRTCEIGQDVPEDLWQAVAEILAFVYQMGKSEAML